MLDGWFLWISGNTANYCKGFIILFNTQKSGKED